MNLQSVICASSVVFLIANAASRAGETAEEGCEIYALPKKAFVGTKELRVLNYSNNPAPLNLGIEEGYVGAIRCFRSSAVPIKNDERVLAKGWPLYLVSSDAAGARKVTVLEISGGQYRLRILEGTLSEEESSQVQAALNAMQSMRQGD